jgi:hypothetical protein
MSKKIYCFKCGEEHEPDDFTPFERNPALADRDGKVIWCRKKCNEYVNERGNTLASLKEILRIVDIPFVESVYKTARKMFTKKVKGTNIVTRKNVYSGENKLQVCSKGVYALCRHPGGWCFLFLYLFLWLYAPSVQMLTAAIVFPGLNFLYIWVQDCYLFPKYIEGYDSYKQLVPFLFPTGHSLRRFLNG